MISSSIDNYRHILTEVLNASQKPVALKPFARIRYPARELEPIINADGSYSFFIKIQGYQYKHRGLRPKKLPQLDCAAIKSILVAAGLPVVSVTDHKTYIKIDVGGRST